jgi:hypothetical protein
MDIIAVILCLIGIAVVAGVSAAVYRSLPSTIFDSATRHGRYFGLGMQELRDEPAGNTPVGNIAALQGQQA